MAHVHISAYLPSMYLDELSTYTKNILALLSDYELGPIIELRIVFSLLGAL